MIYELAQLIQAIRKQAGVNPSMIQLMGKDVEETARIQNALMAEAKSHAQKKDGSAPTQFDKINLLGADIVVNKRPRVMIYNG